MPARIVKSPVLAAGGALVVLAAFGIGAARYRGRPATGGATGEGDAPTAGAIVAWCADGLEAIPGGGCLALPERTKHPSPPVVLYLHGRYESSQPADELDRQKRVAKKSTERGFALLALRGEIGACQRPELATWYCWPSNERTASAGPAFVARWNDSLAEVAKRTPNRERFVFGFSNGAYFAGLIALRGLFDARAFVVAAGGPTEPVEKRPRMPPILLLTGDEDPSAEDTMRFARMLSPLGWPNDIYSRDGTHLLTDADITNAFAFFERAPKESVPLTPPLSQRRPHPIARDAGEQPIAESTSTSTSTSTPTSTATPTSTSTPDE